MGLTLMVGLILVVDLILVVGLTLLVGLILVCLKGFHMRLVFHSNQRMAIPSCSYLQQASYFRISGRICVHSP
ncbi:hypothetical protein BD408DRAFT_425347 [Parasitella parasitica]|nr:hypothetical protein BD408DRAFT_425347 [Parasitella parasitica]